MRWSAFVCLAVVTASAEARVFHCTDGSSPVVGRLPRYGDCDGDAVVNGVCSFQGRRSGEVITVRLNARTQSRLIVGQDRFVCEAAGSEGPLIAAQADSCSEVCTFSLCVSGAVVRRCDDPCAYDFRISVPVDRNVRGVTLTDLSGSGVTAPAVSLWCRYTYLPCFDCRTDADCDDGVPSTRDVCMSTARRGEGCLHLCRGDDPAPPTTTTVTTTSTSVTTTAPQSCDSSSCVTCAMDSVCIVTAEGGAACINSPCQQTGCTASTQCGAHQVCSGGECCPLCP